MLQAIPALELPRVASTLETSETRGPHPQRLCLSIDARLINPKRSAILDRIDTPDLRRFTTHTPTGCSTRWSTRISANHFLQKMKGLHMSKRFTQSLLLTVGMLTALAVAAAPASAVITVNGRANPADISGTSTNTQFIDAGGNTITCPDAGGRGRTAADGRSASLTLTFTTRASGCTARSGLGDFPATVTCSPSVITITSVSSVAGVSATLDVTLDAGFNCSITVHIPIFCPAGSCTINVFGRQGPFRSAARLNQATQDLTVSAPGVVFSGTNLPPGARSPATFSGRYAVSPRFSIS